MGKPEGICKGDELVMVADILRNAVVIAACEKRLAV